MVRAVIIRRVEGEKRNLVGLKLLINLRGTSNDVLLSSLGYGPNQQVGLFETANGVHENIEKLPRLAKRDPPSSPAFFGTSLQGIDSKEKTNGLNYFEVFTS